jgi:DNA repair protein RadC
VLAAIELGRRTLTRADRQRVQVTGPRSVAELLLPMYGNRPVEQFGVVLLDTKHRVMRTTIVTVGTLDASIVHPREIFREAAAAGAAAIVVFHNHPSGDPEPSQEDLVLTRRLVSAGVLMGIEVIDHVVLGNVRYCSMKEQGFI